MKISHTPKSTKNHTQPTIHWELVTGACKRENNPSFRKTNINHKGSFGKGTKREENSYLILTFKP